jgi:beta-glucosidase-like glycosyl hydrolase
MSSSSDTRLGQILILKLKSANWNSRVERLLRWVQPAGVVVPLEAVRPLAFLNNLAKGAATVLRATPLVSWIGYGTAILDFVLPAAEDEARSGRRDANLLRVSHALGGTRGITERGMGKNVDFAISLDLAKPVSQGERAPRAFGHDPRLVAKCGAAYVRGLRQKQVLACAKHFPGMGSVAVNPQTKAMLSAKPMAALWREDLVPFRELLPKLPLVMISHAAYKAYDFDLPHPAVWSSEVVTGLLRVKLGYKGVAVADLTELGWAPNDSNIGEAAVKSLEAGCDLLIIPGNRSSIEGAARAVRAALESGRISAERLEESLRRIRTMRRKLAKPGRAKSARALREEAREIRACAKEIRKYG